MFTLEMLFSSTYRQAVYRLLLVSLLLILGEIAVKDLGLSNELAAEAFLIVTCRLPHSCIRVVFMRLLHVENTTRMVLQRHLNLSDAIDAVFSAGQEAFE